MYAFQCMHFRYLSLPVHLSVRKKLSQLQKMQVYVRNYHNCRKCKYMYEILESDCKCMCVDYKTLSRERLCVCGLRDSLQGAVVCVWITRLSPESGCGCVDYKTLQGAVVCVWITRLSPGSGCGEWYYTHTQPVGVCVGLQDSLQGAVVCVCGLQHNRSLESCVCVWTHTDSRSRERLCVCVDYNTHNRSLCVCV